MNFSIIVAFDEKYGIGRSNSLLCHLSGDLKNFKKLTNGHPIIMGRKTFLSLPNGALPNRTNIVLTHKQEILENCILCKSIDDLLNLDIIKESEENFVIGGASVYKSFIDIADTLYITHIHHTFQDADVFFPEIDKNSWKLISKSETFQADNLNDYPYNFEIYKRINKD